MYPDLSYILHDLLGTRPDNWSSVVKTFGLMLVCSFIVSAYVLSLELKRKEEEGLISGVKEKMVVGKGPSIAPAVLNALLGFFIGFKMVYLFQHIGDIGEDIFPFLGSSRGSVLGGVGGAILLGLSYWMPRQKEKLEKPVEKKVLVHPYQRSTEIAIRAGISGIIGAKLFAIFESAENVKAFMVDPIGQFFSGSGLAIYGGLIMAFAYIFWYVRKKGIKPIHMMDAAAPAMMIGYAIGRVGCQLSGDGDWGIDNPNPAPSWWFLPDNWWAFNYPRNVLQRGTPIEDCVGRYCNELTTAVYPTPLYEMLVCGLLFAVLWSLRKRIKVPGMLFFIYLLFNGIERFFIEKIRINDVIPMLGMEPSQAEIISTLCVIGAIVGMVWVSRAAKKPSGT